MDAKNILLTGTPRCGKSTLIEKVIRKLDRPLTGFFTREIREKGQRVGFAIDTLGGKKGILAHEQSKSPIRVGKYGVNIEELNRIAVPAMIPGQPDQIVIIDEIGKMECFSSLFRETVIQIFDSSNPVLGSIALKGSPFIQTIKERKDVRVLSVTEKNRDSLVDTLLRHLEIS